MTPTHEAANIISDRIESTFENLLKSEHDENLLAVISNRLITIAASIDSLADAVQGLRADLRQRN